jgi:dihydrodipicolinate synthase/N-acetylneuraminate lyase
MLQQGDLMQQTVQFSGIIPPVSTIFTADGQFDKQGTAALVDDMIRAGVDGLFFLGSGGEFSQLNAEERKAIAQFAIDHVNRRVPVLIGTGGTNARETIELSQHAQQAGADGIVVINPYYWKVSEHNLIHYFQQVADSVTQPVILYNFPALTGQDLSPTLVKTLADSRRNIVGIKDTIDSVAHLRSMILTVKSAHRAVRLRRSSVQYPAVGRRWRDIGQRQFCAAGFSEIASGVPRWRSGSGRTFSPDSAANSADVSAGHTLCERH